jgi:hypothetical protein
MSTLPTSHIPLSLSPASMQEDEDEDELGSHAQDASNRARIEENRRRLSYRAQAHPTVTDQDMKEITAFCLPYMNTLKSLLIKKNDLASKLASLHASANADSIPKPMQIKDYSSQIPAAQAHLREEAKRNIRAANTATLQIFIQSTNAEQDRVDTGIQVQPTLLKTAWTAHLKAGREMVDNITFNNDSNESNLYTAMRNHYDSEVLRLGRFIGADLAKRQAKLAKDRQDKQDKEEAMDDVPELTIQQLVAAEVLKQARKKNQPAKKAKANTKSSKKTSKKGKQTSKKGSTTSKKPVFRDPKPRKEPPGSESASAAKGKGRGSGSRKPPNKSSGSSEKRQSQSSKRK